MLKTKKPCNFPVSMLNLSLNRVYKWLQIIKFALPRPKRKQINEEDNCCFELLGEKMSDSIELLNTTGLDHEIEKIFKEEKDFILILSPYLDLTLEIQTILETSPANVVILYCEIKENEYRSQEKKDKIAGYEKSMLKPRVQFFSIPYLHSKAYITSGTIIIASLNLYKQSLDKNFELGIILKKTLYNKIILELYEELKLLFNLNNINIKYLDDLKLPTIDDLFKEIQKKSGKYENDFDDAELLKQFSKLMMRKFNFTKEEKWKKEGENDFLLQRYAKIHNRDMYEWALKNIRL